MRDAPTLGRPGSTPATQSGPAVQRREGQPAPEASPSKRSELRSLPYDEQVQALDPEGGALAREPHHPSGSLDETSVERWIQSALNLLLGSGLTVDGALRGATIPAVRAFQRKAPELAKQRLAVDGIAGRQTIGALEKATDKRAPELTEAKRKAGVPAATPDTEAKDGEEGPDTKGAKGSTDAKASAPAPTPAAEARDEGGGQSEQQVVGELKAEIGKAAAKKTSGPNPVVVDVAQAYDQARQWTMGQHDNPTTKRAAETRERLRTKWKTLKADYDGWVARGKPEPTRRGQKPPKDPGPEADYIRNEWFKGYWSLWCYQFADKVASYMAGRKTSLPALIALTNKDVAAGGDGSRVKGRTIVHRGKTLAKMAEDEKQSPQLEVGALVHVKMHYEGNTPYEFKDDFHHWVVWAGNGKFSDTLTGKDKTGPSNDDSLRNWVKKSFKMQDYKFMHEDPRFSAGKNAKGEPLPRPGIQPLISAEYDPRQNPTQKEG